MTKLSVKATEVLVNSASSKVFGVIVFVCLFLIYSSPIFAQQLSVSIERFNEKELKSNLDNFIAKIDSLSLARKYPEIAKKILSNQTDQQEVALRMLGESQEVIALPWIILLLDSDDKDIKVEAGLAVKNIVSSITLKRRDMNYPQYILLKPSQETDIDLRPIAWIALKLLRADEPSLIAYGITITRYLNLYKFEAEILSHKESIHPAVTNTMNWAIEELQLQKKYESGELKVEK